MSKNQVIVKQKEIWEDSEDEYKMELESEVKNYEAQKRREIEEIEREEEEKITKFEEIQAIIGGMCEDMKNEHPNIENKLAGLIKKLEEQSNMVKEEIKGGGKKKKDKIIGKRLSELTEEERNLNPSKQSKFTKQQIAERLKNFSKVSKDELFDIIKKGMWIRYFKEENGVKLFRTGGFITHIDEEEHKYVTLISHHANNSFTWNMQIETMHSVYIPTRYVKAYRLKTMDKKYGLREGTTNFLNTWFVFDSKLMMKMETDNQNLIYIFYDKANHKLYAPTKKQTNKHVLEYLGIEAKVARLSLLKGLKQQLESPIQGIYIVNVVEKKDLQKIKKMKSRIKG